MADGVSVLVKLNPLSEAPAWIFVATEVAVQSTAKPSFGVPPVT